MSIATERRDSLAIRKRILMDFGFRATRFAMKKLRGQPMAAKKILLYPEVGTLEQLADLLNRATWYLPPTNGVEVTLAHHPSLQVNQSEISTHVPKAQQNYLGPEASVRLLQGLKRWHVEEADQILVWKSSALPHLGTRISKAIVVDPYYFSSVESSCWAESIFRSFTPSEKRSKLEQYRKNFSDLTQRVNGFERSYVFTTGPSIELAEDMEFEKDSFKIICNSIVKNKDLMRKVRPQLLVFADPVFHYSPCKYDHEFRRLALEAIEEFDCYIMTPERRAPLLLAQFPQLRDRVIGMPVLDKKEVNFPSLDKFYTTNTRNIMTLFMVPTASALSSEICILGADGRQKGENYFWKHSAKNQMHDLMDTAIATHPSFFRDRDYKDYYNYHCGVVAEQIRTGEQMGKNYVSLTPSWIPALTNKFLKK